MLKTTFFVLLYCLTLPGNSVHKQFMVKCRTLCSDIYWSKILRLSDSQRCIQTNRNTFKNWNFHFQTTDLLSNYNNVKTHNIISNIISSTVEIGIVGKNRTGRHKNRTRNVKDDEYPLTPNCVSPQTLLGLFSVPPFPSQLIIHALQSQILRTRKGRGSLTACTSLNNVP